jgi:hypothetical protein
VHNYIFSLFENITFSSQPLERKVSNINELTSGKEPNQSFSFKSSTPDGGKRRKTKTNKKIKKKTKKRKQRMGYQRRR